MKNYNVTIVQQEELHWKDRKNYIVRKNKNKNRSTGRITLYCNN